MSKGKRRERQASELYEQAGYETYRPPRTKYGETDMFGLFDMVALPTFTGRTTFVQVKSNRAQGINAWSENVSKYRLGTAQFHFVVCHDHTGWRLAAQPDLMHDGYVWVVDEREQDCNMGDGVIEYLRKDE